MPTLNDFGDAAVARVERKATEIANGLGIQPELIIQYFNDTAHFPQTLDELERWGRTPDREYGFTRLAPNGVWTPLYQGVTPGKAENDPGFRHRINNEVGRVQRFQQVDAGGNVFGGSWDPAYNAAHPELAGKTGFDTAVAAPSRSAQGGGSVGSITAPQPGQAAAKTESYAQMMQRYMDLVNGGPRAGGPTQQIKPALQQARGAAAMDQNNYVAPLPGGGGFVSVVGGVSNVFPTQPEAEQDFNQRTGGGGGTAPAGSESGGVSAPSSSGGGGGGSSAGGGPSFPGVNLGQEQLSLTHAYNLAQLAYLREKMNLIDKPLTDAQIEKMAMDSAHQAVADALANKKFEQIDLPMLKLQQEELTQAKYEFEKKFGLEQGTLDLQRQQAAQDAVLRGTDIASREAVQRAQMGMEGLGTAEQIGTQRGQLAQSGFQGAEELARGADEYVRAGAGQLNDTAMQAIDMASKVRGSRNAWVQQAVMRGLNEQGLTSDIGAIAGEYDAANFMAPQARAQGASLGSQVQDILMAGGVPTGGNASMTPNAMLRAMMTNRMNDPYGAGGRAMFAQAQDIVDDPYGTYGRQLGEQALGQLANQYTSPSSIAAMRTAWQNMPEAQANGPTAAMRGAGQRINDGWFALKSQLGRNPTSQETAGLVASVTGLPMDVADRIGALGTDYFVNTGQVIPPDILEQRVVQAAQSVGGLQQAPGAIGAPDRLDRSYWNLRRQTGETPGPGDPRVQRMYREEGSPNPDLSAWHGADWYSVNQYPIPFGPQVGNVTAPRPRTMVPADDPNWDFPQAPGGFTAPRTLPNKLPKRSLVGAF